MSMSRKTDQINYGVVSHMAYYAALKINDFFKKTTV
jgi:hypothetical protein